MLIQAIQYSIGGAVLAGALYSSTQTFRQALKQGKGLKMHKQAGYQFARTQTRSIAILHGTAVAEITSTHAILRTGGWHTRATAKAMNAALNQTNVDITVNLKTGVLQATTPEGVFDIGFSREFTL